MSEQKPEGGAVRVEAIVGAADHHKLMRMIAAATAHRVCCGTEHDAQNGKLHGYCIVCGVPWPCETAEAFLFVRPNAELSRVAAKEKT